MLGLTIALVLSYFVSSVFRLSAGDSASKAWTPSWALIGFWAVIALLGIAFPPVMSAIKRRQSRVKIGR